MLFIALLIASCTSVLAVLFLPRMDRFLAWALTIFVSILAGTRIGGFDYDQYELIIYRVRSELSADWIEAIFLAKDPFFFLIIRLTEYVSNETTLVYLAVAFLSMGTKLIATQVVPGRRTIFIALYAVFLAPGLEFAAIRSAMGIGFVVLALAIFSPLRWCWFFAAVVSHLSMLVPLIGKLLVGNRLLLLFIVPVGAIVFNYGHAYFTETRLYGDYSENQGRLTALFMPMITLLALIGVMFARSESRGWGRFLSTESVITTSFVVFSTLLLALPIVTASTRLLEVSWTLILLQILSFHGLSWRRFYLLLFSGFLLFSVLIFSNVKRELWITLSTVEVSWW